MEINFSLIIFKNFLHVNIYFFIGYNKNGDKCEKQKMDFNYFLNLGLAILFYFIDPFNFFGKNNNTYLAEKSSTSR